MKKLGPLIDRLLTLDPGTPQAEQQQRTIEGVLMAALATGGRSAGEALVHSLAVHDYDLQRIDALPCMWRVLIPRPHVLELWFAGGDESVVAALSYHVGTPWGTKRQKRAAELQAAFYSRYEKLCSPKVVEEPPLEPDDWMILVLGEFEADVNNGGLGQYLENKGVERAVEVLAYLKTVRAKRTARWLSSALQAGVDSAALEGLDQQFYDKPEDLASLVMRYLESQRKH